MHKVASERQELEVQLLPEEPMQHCLGLPGVACNNALSDAIHIVSPYGVRQIQ